MNNRQYTELEKELIEDSIRTVRAGIEEQNRFILSFQLETEQEEIRHKKALHRYHSLKSQAAENRDKLIEKLADLYRKLGFN
jgi:hypothetical protein